MRGLALISALTLIGCGGRSSPASEPTPTVETEPAVPAAPPPPPDVAPWVAPPPRPDVVEVLKQVPQAATFVAGLDVARMSRGALASRFRSMMALAVAFAPPSCAALSVDHFDRVVAAGVGTKGEHVVFLGPALEERVAGACLATATMKKNNVSIVQRKELGTTVYTSTGPGAGDDALAWTPRSGPIIADRQDWVLATLDPLAPKATPELVALASSADHGRMVWLAAQVDVADLADFPMPPNTVTGPFTLRVGIDLDDTADVDLDLVFSSTADATHAADYLRGELDQAWLEAPEVGDQTHARIGVHGTEVRMVLHVDATSVDGLLKQLPLPGG